MTISEVLIFAKILAYIFGDRTISVTETEKKYAAEALKRIADQRMDWTQEQREQYKMWVEVFESIRRTTIIDYLISGDKTCLKAE